LDKVEELTKSDTNYSYKTTLKPSAIGGDANQEDIETIMNRNQNAEESSGEEDNQEGI